MDVEQQKSCPSCSRLAEPEQDGDLIYYACESCGYEFGYRQARQEGMCAAGIMPLPSPEPAQVFIGSIGRRPE
jgi:hypothetical protein